jgi:hypothetical protein
MNEMRAQRIRELEKQRPADMAKVMGLIKRSDALGAALHAYEDEENTNPEMKAEALEILGVMCDEVGEQLAQAKRELGIPAA